MHKGFYVHSIKFPDNPLEFRIKFKFNQDDLKNDGVESLWYDTSAKDEITIKSKGGTVEEIFKTLAFYIGFKEYILMLQIIQSAAISIVTLFQEILI